jgi:hypothetical protein
VETFMDSVIEVVEDSVVIHSTRSISTTRSKCSSKFFRIYMASVVAAATAAGTVEVSITKIPS